MERVLVERAMAGDRSAFNELAAASVGRLYGVATLILREEDGQIVSEEFYVPDALWDATCPDDQVVRWTSEDGTSFGQGSFVICLGCFERGLGRTMTLRDFLGDAKFDAMSDEERSEVAEDGPLDPEYATPSKTYLKRWQTVT